MINSWHYTENRVKGDLFLENTGNVFEYVTQRPYQDKKGKLPNGVTLTLHILEDKGNYGVDKDTGKIRPTNQGQNFDATILCGQLELPFKPGDLVSLDGFDYENSMAIGFDLLFRFHAAKKVGEITHQQKK